MLHVPYRASPAATQDLLAGRVDLFVADQAVILPASQGGRLRILAVTTRTRSPQLPEVPTVAEAANLPNYELFAWFVIAAPAGTPAAVVSKISTDVIAALKTDDMVRQIALVGFQPVGETPQQFTAFLVKDRASAAERVKAADVKME